MKLAFIWHMHQPYYKDLKSGEYLMPWVRLHGTKDYLDMLLLLDEFPGIRQTFNLVPSLLDQIVDYTDNGASDHHLYLSRKPVVDLTDEERLEITETFFSAHFETMIQPYPRYKELYKRCRDSSPRMRLSNLSDQDYLDLQFWSNAAWIDPMFRGDAKIANLFKKGREFTEEEKNYLLEYQLSILRRIIPEYQKHAHDGRIEVSFSPYYHPILPLLVDTEIARMAVPGAELPLKRFVHPEDADVQIGRAIQLYRRLFGDENPGMWPSEGSVSEAILPILQKHAVKWIATDEEIYFASMNLAQQAGAPEISQVNGFHRAFSVGGPDNPIGLLFRDHKLSDKIGFVYSGWEPSRAVDDFMNSLKQLDKLLSGNGEEPIVAVILDGENAWEYYRNDGADFLRALYSRLEKEKGITTVLPKELFAAQQPVHTLPRLFAGSWINHNFAVWIGHTEDNSAWDLVKQTRDKLVERQISANPPNGEVLNKAWEAIYIAEGSDWCWWYGDDHHTDQFLTFDLLFRRHLSRVWELIGLEPPLALMRPIRRVPRLSGVHEPTDFLNPIIDGKQTSFFEWFGAGRIECRKLGGAMHRADARIFEIMFGYNDRDVIFRVDFEKERNTINGLEEVNIELNCGVKLIAGISRTSAKLRRIEDVDNFIDLTSSWDQVLEVAIPRNQLKFEEDKHLYFAVSLVDGQKVVERWPDANYIPIELPKPGDSFFWQV